MKDEVRIFPLGDAALTIEFGRTISEHLNAQAIALADHVQSHSFEGFVEAVPAYASTTIFYDPSIVSFDDVKKLVGSMETSIPHDPSRRIVEIEAVFDGPDLDALAAFAGLSKENVIDIFLSKNYRVYMLGFLPGFTYMAEVDARVAMPRKESPRNVVPKGSIGIAGKQTGIYSLPSPGGWQLIGRTELEMFSPDANPLTLVLPGDEIKFVAV